MCGFTAAVHGADTRWEMSLGERFPQVLEAARAGEEWAIAALYRDLQPRVVTYLRHRCRDDAEDVAQETWIDVARALGRFEGGENDSESSCS